MELAFLKNRLPTVENIPSYMTYGQLYSVRMEPPQHNAWSFVDRITKTYYWYPYLLINVVIMNHSIYRKAGYTRVSCIGDSKGGPRGAMAPLLSFTVTVLLENIDL